MPAEVGVRGDTVWHPEHRAAAQAIAPGRHTSDERLLRLVASAQTPEVSRLESGDGDFDVETRTSTPGTTPSAVSSHDRRQLCEQSKADLGYRVTLDKVA